MLVVGRDAPWLKSVLYFPAYFPAFFPHMQPAPFVLDPSSILLLFVFRRRISYPVRLAPSYLVPRPRGLPT